MTARIESTYYVGKDQPYKTVNQAVNSIAAALGTGNYVLPPDSLPDGGQVSIILVGNGKFPPVTIPDNMTVPLKEANRYLIIKRQEFTENGTVLNNTLPIITPMAQSGSEIAETDKLIGIDLGSNNPNVKVVGLKIDGFVIGLAASFNCNSLYIDRCFFTNSVNAQIYVHDIDGFYATNNVIVGGQYGLVVNYTKNIRVYHNTIYLDGLTALDGKTKAGAIIQGERLFTSGVGSTAYFLGNLVFTIGCPAVIFYDEDLKNGRLVSDYNDLYSQTAVVQLRQDNATLPEDSNQVIKSSYTSISNWRLAGPLGSNTTARTDQNSISIHPVFIQNISLLGASSSIVNLGIIDNSPLLNRVPSWYNSVDLSYVPTDFDESLISTDCLLNSRQIPLTSIGANDKISINGFFGQDIFTSPLDLDPEKKCDLDPLNLVSSQELEMIYPTIKAGYFYSHERAYYLYGKKAACALGQLAVTQFALPSFLKKDSVKVYAKDKEVPKENWDIIGKTLLLKHTKTTLSSYEDEIQVIGQASFWSNNSFSYADAYYIYKLIDGKTSFVLPADYVSTAPIVITDDRVSYLNPSDAVAGEFTTEHNPQTNEVHIVFGGNENLLENSDFSYTISGNLPSYWVANTQDEEPSVFMLGTQYAYWGNQAVAIACYNNPGYITSRQIPASYDKPITLSWHASIPTGITGVDGSSVNQLTGYYNITFFDNYDEQMAFTVDGSFEINNRYNRNCVTLGPSDTLLDLNASGLTSAPLSRLNTIPISIPSTVTKLELTLSGGNYSGQISTGSFFILDAVQAEYSADPSYYHPKPSLNGMTIEFETSSDGVFTDKRMNLTPVFNKNPNGFLYISDMPATIWGGPSDPEITTLHEYRWPHGRINVMPWARIHGKDKLVERGHLKGVPSTARDIIAPYVLTRRAAEAIITPGQLIVNQDAELPDGFAIQVLDELGNPYGLRNFVCHVYDANGNFPGWLAKQYHGAKEQLGSTAFGALDSNGSASLWYSSPASNHIRYVGFVPDAAIPTTGLSGAIDNVTFIKTNYNVSSENNGNITIIGENGKFYNTNGQSVLSGKYIAESNNGNVFISLEYPPVFGTVKLRTEDNQYRETQSKPQTNEFLVNYEFGHLELQAEGLNDSIYFVEYYPKFAYPSPKEKNKIVIHKNRILSGYNGPVQIDYDAEISIELRVANPLNREFIATFPIILQNPKLSLINNQSLQFEF